MYTMRDHEHWGSHIGPAGWAHVSRSAHGVTRNKRREPRDADDGRLAAVLIALIAMDDASSS